MLMKISIRKIYNSPHGWSGTCTECAEKLGCTPSNFRTRLARWGEDDERTWKHKNELKTRKGRSRDEQIYQSPGGKYKGKIDDICKALGIGRQCFIHRKKMYGIDDLRTWMNAEQSEIYRVTKARLQHGETPFWWLDKLEWSFGGWPVKVVVDNDGKMRIA